MQLFYSFPVHKAPNAASVVERLLVHASTALIATDAADRLRKAAAKGVLVADDLSALSLLLQAVSRSHGEKSDQPSTLTEFLKLVDAKPQLGPLPEPQKEQLSSSQQQGHRPSFPANKTLGEMTDEEKEVWREAMRARAAHRDYNSLTSDVRWREVEQARAESFATYKQQLSIGLNVIVSLITACVFGWFMGKHLVDQHNKAGPWIVSAAFGAILLMVEAVLIVTRLGSHDAARKALQERAMQGDADALAAVTPMMGGDNSSSGAGSSVRRR